MDVAEKYSSKRAILLGIIFVILGFLCAFLLYRYFTKVEDLPPSEIIAHMEQETTALLEEPIVVEEEQKSSGKDISVDVEEKVEEPVVEGEYFDRQIPSLVLNGIFATATGSYALINNRIVREGETILGVEVVHIRPNKVELNAHGKQIILRVK
ncbi:hypothetical protein ACFL2J_05190 [Candidatus Omnitrophota bacterium]